MVERYVYRTWKPCRKEGICQGNYTRHWNHTGMVHILSFLSKYAFKFFGTPDTTEKSIYNGTENLII
jgi:hypothetical protein